MAYSLNDVQSELKEACKLYKNFTNFIMQKGYRSLIKDGHISNAADCLESVINVMEIMEEIIDGGENLSLNRTLGLRRMFSTPKTNESLDGTLGLKNIFEPAEDDPFNESHYTTAFNSSIFDDSNDLTALYTSSLQDLNEDFPLEKSLDLRRMFHEDKNKSLIGNYGLKNLFALPMKNQALDDTLGLRELFEPHKKEADLDKLLQVIEDKYLLFIAQEYENETRTKPSNSNQRVNSQIPKLSIGLKPIKTRQPLTWDDLNTDDEFDEDDYDPLDYPEWTRDKSKLKQLMRQQEALNSDFASFFPQNRDPNLQEMFPQMTPSRRRRILKRTKSDSKWDVPAVKPRWKI